MGVGWRVSRGALRDGFDNPHPEARAANTVSSILAGQIFASILLDHFGFLNLPVHAVTLPRIVSAVLVVIGVIVVLRT